VTCTRHISGALSITIGFLAATGCSHLPGREAGITYSCASGERPVAFYPSPETAVLAYRGETHRLHRVISASGARYADDTFVWWIKGSEASLFAVERDESTGQRLDVCRVANGKQDAAAS
jgi:membrane-bound inhibitor of C-type lysozyme